MIRIQKSLVDTLQHSWIVFAGLFILEIKAMVCDTQALYSITGCWNV